MYRYKLLLIFISLLFSKVSFSASNDKKLPRVVKTIQSEGMTIAIEKIAEGMDVPWGFDFVPGGRYMIVTERVGRISVLDLETYQRRHVEGVPEVFASNQGGLLDLLLHPEFEKNRILYFTYAARAGSGSTTRLAAATLTRDGKLENLKVLFSADKPGSSSVHYGSRLAIDANAYLFMSIGDRGERERAQDLSDHGGKVIRLKLDGTVPKDNPFVKQKGAKPEIWTWGHRNPQGLAVHPKTQQVWEQEHGPRGGDEVNVLRKGANYGWPVITHGREYAGPAIGQGTAKKGMEQPVKHWTPSIAPCGLSFYFGGAFPKWEGNLFSGALAQTHINRLVLDGEKVLREERLLDDWQERVRNIRQAPDGLLYFSVDSGKIFRMKPSKP